MNSLRTQYSKKFNENHNARELLDKVQSMFTKFFSEFDN